MDVEENADSIEKENLNSTNRIPQHILLSEENLARFNVGCEKDMEEDPQSLNFEEESTECSISDDDEGRCER